jgi:hypothetical protein
MSFKLSAISLFAMSALFMDGANAQPIAAPICAESVRGDLNSGLISVRVSDGNYSLVAVKTDAKGNVTDCMVAKSAGSERADRDSCDWVKSHWRSLGRCP